jgi:hypothetical protein
MLEYLYHVSDLPGISRFEPRPVPNASAGQQGTMVWAIDDAHLHNYLLPRDCPRVTFYPHPGSNPADVERLMAGSSARCVVAIESGWLETVRRGRLYVYTLPGEGFSPVDVGAGYHTSQQAVDPVKVEEIDDLLGALTSRNVELRVMPSLWKLRDLVIDSTLQFSIIRFRNAQSPPEGYIPRHG